jgi:hypothetical protein
MQKTELYWIYAQHNNSWGLFFIVYNAGAYCIGRRRWMFLPLIDRIWGHHRAFCEKLADNSSNCNNEKHHKHSVSGT